METTKEENTYFKNVVKDAVSDLKSNRQAYVFYKDQIDAVKEHFEVEIKVKEKDGLYYLTKKK